jgi:hypothetical protein
VANEIPGFLERLTFLLRDLGHPGAEPAPDAPEA